ncbi:MAG: ATP-binding protein [Opitutus sp.]|nr:ATP-binding protein [Opitutus sp.]
MCRRRLGSPRDADWNDDGAWIMTRRVPGVFRDYEEKHTERNLRSLGRSGPPAHPDSLAGGELPAEVQDNGHGIAPELADSLFKPFATHGKSQGTGLGFTICRRIAEDHGGRIFVAERSCGGYVSFSASSSEKSKLTRSSSPPC